MYYLYMKNEFAFIIAYISAFGLSDILVEYFKMNRKMKLFYYITLMIIALYFILIHKI